MTKSEEALQNISRELAQIRERVQIHTEELVTLKDTTKRIAVLESKVEEINKAKDLWGQRGWTVFTVILSAIFSLVAALLTTGLMYILNVKR